MEDDILKGQKLLEEHVEKNNRENLIDYADKVNGMIKPKQISCSFHDKTITVGYPVEHWQTNRGGNMHGGMICTAMDATMAVLARFYAKENFAPTVSLDVKYIRPIKEGDVLVVIAEATATGKRITQIACKAHSKKNGKLIATGAAVYMNSDTLKEKRQ